MTGAGRGERQKRGRWVTLGVLLLSLAAAHVSDRAGWTRGASPLRASGPRDPQAPVWLPPALGVVTAAALLTPGGGWAAAGFGIWAAKSGYL